jgi:hypothetical protein
MNKIQLAIVVSDLHCGSVVGLAAPYTATEHGNVVGFGSNVHQAWLWDNWSSMIEQVRAIVGADDAALIINGDATEGVHHRNDAEILASNIETHINMAHQCLAPLAELCKEVFVTAGTECHTRNMENVLAQRLGAVGAKAKDKWLIRINDCLIDVAHHMPTSGRAYLEASSMSICMGNARQNYLRCGHEVPRIYLRGHRHCGGHYSDGNSLFCATGAWQFLTRHGHKVVTDSIPRPSVVILDWRQRRSGELPDVKEILFNPPQNEIKNL